MEDKNVQKLLDMLFGMIDEAKGATFSSEKCVINRDEALDLLDEIRNKLPGRAHQGSGADEVQGAVCGQGQSRGPPHAGPGPG